MLVGLVGKPNAGKSTFFSALTLIPVQIAPYPFTTIQPNKGVGHVRVACAEKDFSVKCRPQHGFCENGQRFVPMEVLDVAGLVPGAHQGKGLGNQFLDDLRQADVLIHVVDLSGSTDEKGDVVEAGSHDPRDDVRFLEEELNLWFLGIVKKNLSKYVRQPIASKTQLIEVFSQELSGLGISANQLDLAIQRAKLPDKKIVHWQEDDFKAFAVKLREISKPILIAANKADLPTSSKNLERLLEEFPGLSIIPCSAESELALKKAAKGALLSYLPGDAVFSALKELAPAQKDALESIRKKVLEKYGGTGVQKAMNAAVFEVLKLVPVFPVPSEKLTDQHGNILPDCKLVPAHTTTLDFAFRLHTDIGKNFIKAVDVRTHQLRGKEELVKPGDVLQIVFKK